MSSTSAKRKTSAVSAGATSKKHRTDPAVDELKIARIKQVANDAGVEEEVYIERASSLLEAWDFFSVSLNKLPNADEVDLAQISVTAMGALKSRSRTLADALHVYKSFTNKSAKDLPTWLLEKLESDEFLVTMLHALKACQRANPQTLAPFHEFIVLRFAQPSNTSPRIQTIQYDVKALETAWRGHYQGNAHKTLLNSINADDRVNAYGCMAVLYQSSGYGKSRIVHEMSAEVVTIPLNIRAQEEENQGAFPPRDAPIATIFQAIDRVPNTKQVGHNSGKLGGLFQFFHLLFDAVLDTIQPLSSNGDSRVSLPERWRDYLQTAREGLYVSVSKKWHEWVSVHELNDNLKSAPLLDAAANSFRQLIKAIVPGFKERRASRDDRIKLFMYIDEAQSLVSAQEKDPLFDLTQDAIDMFTWVDPNINSHNNFATHFFTLFLSTTSHAKDIAKPHKLFSSARVVENRVAWLAPHTVMPFDCHRELAQKVVPDMYTLEEVAEFKFLVRMGRTLWWAYFESLPGDMNAEVKAQKVMAMVRTKLTAMSGWTKVDPGSLLDNNRPGFAVLDALLNLDYNPTREPTVQTDLIARHLRTAYSAPFHHEYFYSGYPSEPVIPLAAMQLVDELQGRMARESKRGDSFVRLFSDLETYGAIDMGQRGENVGKMLLIRAYMDATRKNSLRYSDGCPLLDFLECLLSPRFSDTWRTCHPNNIRVAPGPEGSQSQTLAEAFPDAWVRFFHFIRASDDSAMTTEMARIAVTRGAAVIGWRNQAQVDVVIPIVRKKGDKLSEQNMTVLLVQFKLRTKAGSVNQYLIDTNELGVFPTLENGRFRVSDRRAPPPSSKSRKGVSNSWPYDFPLAPQLTVEEAEASLARPYITLVMELGIRDRQSSKAPKPTPFAVPAPSTNTPAGPLGSIASASSPNVFKVLSPGRARPRRNATKKLIPMHQRYSLIAYGCSSATYRCVQEDDHARLSMLLHANDLLHETPRPDLRRQIIGMKPFWGMEQGGYDWIQEPYFPSELPMLDEEEIDGVATVEVIDDSGIEGEDSDTEGDLFGP